MTLKIKILYCLKSSKKDGSGHLARGVYIRNFLNRKKININFISNNPKSFKKFNLNKKEIINKKLVINKNLYSFIKKKKFNFVFFDLIEKINPRIIKKISQISKIVMLQNITRGMNYCFYNIFPCLHLSKSDLNLINKFNNYKKKNILYGKNYLIIKKIKKQKIKKKLISIYAGGSDPYNISEIILKMISNSKVLANFEFQFFYGNLFDENKIFKLQKYKIPIKRFNIKHISSSVVVISTFGLITYELLSINVKQLIISYNSAHDARAKILSKKYKTIKNLGIYKNISQKNLIKNINYFIDFKNKVVSNDIKDMTPRIMNKLIKF